MPELQTRRRNPILVVLALVYLAVWFATGAYFMADTSVYTNAIIRHVNGLSSDYRQVTANPFWDFGHLLWRPLGWLCFVILRPLTCLVAPQNLRVQIILTLIAINFVAAIICTLYFFRLAKALSGKVLSAAAAAIGLLCANAFLNYEHAGSPYICGLCCLVIGMWFLWRPTSPGSISSASLPGGLMLALAVLFWLPYIFVLPAAFAGPLLLWKSDRGQLQKIVQALAACAVLGFCAYVGSALAIHISTVQDARQWISSSGHGWIPLTGFRAVADLAFSVPRSFINMSRDGMWLKRFIVHDPYAPVSAAFLLRLSLWKLGLFYLSAFILCVELFRSQRGRMLLVIVVTAALPLFVFATIIFEPGSVERYLPLYPFFLLPVAYVVAEPRTLKLTKPLLLLTILSIVVVDVNAMRRDRLNSSKAAAVSRIQAIVPILKPNSLLIAVHEQDNLAQLRQNFPLDPISLSPNLNTYDALEINAARLSNWKQDLSTRILNTWQRGGDVWLPARFFAPRPDPQWNWVEGGDKRIKWTDLPAFFSKFEVGPVIGGSDGFVLLPDAPTNRELLMRLTKTSPSSEIPKT